MNLQHATVWPPSHPHGGDGHADVLVESAEYPRPAPGWWALRAWHIVPMHLRVEVHTSLPGLGDAPKAVTRMCGTFQHPDHAYIMEVTRQLLAGERMAWLSAADSQNWIFRGPLYVETVRWSDTPKGSGEWISSYADYALWHWDMTRSGLADARVPNLTTIPRDIFRATWHPAPHTL